MTRALLAGLLAALLVPGAQRIAFGEETAESPAAAIGIDHGAAYRMGGETGISAGPSSQAPGAAAAPTNDPDNPPTFPNAAPAERDQGVALPAIEQMRAQTRAPEKVDEVNLGNAKVVTAYRDGHAFNLRVYGVGHGEWMAQKPALGMLKLLAAAKAAGIDIYPLSGFRTMAEQQYLWNEYGSPRAAHPGYSNHQQGEAMDFGNVGGYGSKNYRWLKANGRTFGYVNDVSGEPWHFDFQAR